MAIFQPIPFPDCIYDEVHRQNNNETVNRYVFQKFAQLGSVIDLNDCYFYGKIQIQYNNANMHSNRWSKQITEMEGVPLYGQHT